MQTKVTFSEEKISVIKAKLSDRKQETRFKNGVQCCEFELLIHATHAGSNLEVLWICLSISYPCLSSIYSSTAHIVFRIDRTNAFGDIQQMYLLLNVCVLKKDWSKLAEKGSGLTAAALAYSMF